MGETVTRAVDFVSGQDTSSDALGGSMSIVRNVLYDAAGVAHARPGISYWAPFAAGSASGSPVIGMIGWKQWLVFVTADRKIHAVTTAGTLDELSDLSYPTSYLDGGSRPSFVPGRDMLVISGGGALQKWEGTGLSTRLSASAPEGNDICGIAGRLVVAPPNDTGMLYWSQPLEVYDGWDMATMGAGYIQASSKPDPVVAMTDNTNEVFAWGKESLQVFVPSNLAVDALDPDNLLDFAPSRTLNVGITAPDGIVMADDMYHVVDRNRRIVLTDGRGYKDISKQVVKRLREMDTIDDCWGFRLRYSRYDCAVFMFPQAEVGLVYDRLQGKWSEWTEWNGGDVPLRITSAYYWAENDVFLVGMTSGLIAQLDDTATTDLGQPIKVQLIAGFNADTGLKVNKSLNLTFRRKFVSTSGSGHVLLSARDYEGAWEPLAMIELADVPYPSEVLRALGVYRQRQLMIEYTGDDGFDFVSAVETFEQLGD